MKTADESVGEGSVDLARPEGAGSPAGWVGVNCSICDSTGDGWSWTWQFDSGIASSGAMIESTLDVGCIARKALAC